MALLRKTTQVYATHGIPLECDIYDASDYPTNSPVFLYFHPGGLVGWRRDCLPPWLVQVCFQRKWPLISFSYRLLPQVGAKGLLEDAEAAYEFALAFKGEKRRVIAGGASGGNVVSSSRCSLLMEDSGFFTAALIAHHCSPPPLALFSIEGINTFRHPFFNSSTLLTEEVIPDEVMAPFLEGEAVVGTDAPDTETPFRMEKLRVDGSKNPNSRAEPLPLPVEEGGHSRGELYDYFTYRNAWLDLVGEIDLGYDWALKDEQRKVRFPPTIIVHGDADDDVPIGLSEQMRECLGEEKVAMFVAKGQPHLYERTLWIEDQSEGIDAVREAVRKLDDVVGDGM